MKEIRFHGDGVYTVVLSGQNLPSFKPGQFTHLSIEDYDPAGGFWPESRVFSIASMPNNQEITIVYSVKGSYTRRMQEYLQNGKTVWLKLPFGDFTITEEMQMRHELILIAGGTGVAPYIPFLEELAKSENTPNTILLFYGFRNANHFLFKEKMRACLDRIQNFKLTLWIESLDNWKDAGQWKINSGLISLEDVIAKSAEFSSPLFFLSGPPAMIWSFKDKLNHAGRSESQIKIDEW